MLNFVTFSLVLVVEIQTLKEQVSVAATKVGAELPFIVGESLRHMLHKMNVAPRIGLGTDH